MDKKASQVASATDMTRAASASFTSAVNFEEKKASLDEVLDVDASLDTISETMHEGDLAHAETLARELIARKPQNFRVMHILGMCLHQRGKHREAIYWLTKVARFTKERIEIGLALGQSLSKLGRYEHAAKIYQKLVDESPEAMEAYAGLAQAYIEQQLYDKAMMALQTAIDMNPTHTDSHMALGNLLYSLARYSEALGVYESITALQPNHVAALAAICDLTPHHHMEDASMQMLQVQLERGQLTDDEATLVHFALGRAYDALGNRNAAMEHVKKGNQLKRLTLRYAVEQDAKLFTRLRSLFTSELFHKHRKHAVQDDSTVFIVGMPRAGMNLLEHMLSCHSRIDAGDGNPHLHAICCEPHAAMERFGFPDYAQHLSEEGIQAMGIEYLQRRNNRTTARFVTDTAPNNFIYLGMAKLLMPNAKIIHITRNAVDTCLSAYQHLFPSSMPFAYDLREVGEFYHLYEELMAHWKAVLPEGSILEITYEDLVRFPQTTLEDVFSFLGLSHEDACLTQDTLERALPLNSVQAVRSPLHAFKIRAWQHYRNHITTLLDVLNIQEDTESNTAIISTDSIAEAIAHDTAPEAEPVAEEPSPQPVTPPIITLHDDEPAFTPVFAPKTEEAIVEVAPVEVAPAAEVAPEPAPQPAPKKKPSMDTLRMVSGFGSAYLYRGGTLKDDKHEA